MLVAQIEKKKSVCKSKAHRLDILRLWEQTVREMQSFAMFFLSSPRQTWNISIRNNALIETETALLNR